MHSSPIFIYIVERGWLRIAQSEIELSQSLIAIINWAMRSASVASGGSLITSHVCMAHACSRWHALDASHVELGFTQTVINGSIAPMNGGLLGHRIKALILPSVYIYSRCTTDANVIISQAHFASPHGNKMRRAARQFIESLAIIAFAICLWHLFWCSIFWRRWGDLISPAHTHASNTKSIIYMLARKCVVAHHSSHIMRMHTHFVAVNRSHVSLSEPILKCRPRQRASVVACSFFGVLHARKMSMSMIYEYQTTHHN